MTYQDWHISAYLLDELDLAEAAAVQRRVGGDNLLDDEMITLQRTINMVTGCLGAEPTSETLQWEEPWKNGARWARIRKPLAYAGAAAAAVALVAAGLAWPDGAGGDGSPSAGSQLAATGPEAGETPTPEVGATGAPAHEESRPGAATTPAPQEPSAAAGAVNEIVVRCRKDGAADPSAVVMATDGSLRPGAGQASITGLKKGERVTMVCKGAQGWRAEVEHVVAGGRETVYLAMTRTSKTSTPSKEKRAARPKTVKRKDTGIGTLTIHAKPWAKCSVDGKAPRTTRFSVSLRAGKYKVTCWKGGEKKTKRVRVRGKKARTVNFDFN